MNEQINLMEVFRLFLFHWWKIVLAAVLTAFIAFGLTEYCIMPTYTARGSLYVNNNTKTTQMQAVQLADIATAQQLAYTCIELLTSDTFLATVQEYSGLPYSVRELKGMLSLSPLNETEIIEIVANTENPEHSQKLVNAILDNAHYEIDRVVGGGNVKVVDSAALPKAPSSPSMVRNVILGFMLGAFVCMVLIFLLDTVDNRVKIEADLMDVKELPLLGVIPDINYMRAEVKKNGRK